MNVPETGGEMLVCCVPRVVELRERRPGCEGEFEVKEKGAVGQQVMVMVTMTSSSRCSF
jgi:hypothetical protein